MENVQFEGHNRNNSLINLDSQLVSQLIGHAVN